MEHYTVEEGHELTDDSPDVVVLNTCTVKGPTQTAIESRLEELTRLGKKVVVAGCFSQSSPDHPLLQDFPVVGPDSADQIALAIRSAVEEKPVQLLKRKKAPLPLVPPTHSPSKPFILSISQGCLSSCSFCMTKLARGNLRSHTIRHLRNTTREAIARGHQEIYLTSQDTSAYGLDIGTDLVHLLDSLLSIDGDFFIRIGMANPQHFSHFQKDLWKLFESENLYRFLHIPVQSGSEPVLLHMRREHTAKDYLCLVEEGRSRYPDLSIATDIICGYPTETEKDYADTLSVLRESRPDAVNISRFWPRPGTRAAQLKELPGSLVKTRTREVTRTYHRISRARNRSWLGWEGDVLVTEGPKQERRGRNRSYKQVLLRSRKGLSIGERTGVQIKDYSTFDIRT